MTRYQRHCEWIALLFITLCFFVMPISVSLTTITYLAAFFFILISGNWKQRWQKVRRNPVIYGFWILFALFVVGVFYTVSHSHFVWRDLHKRHWMLITPFFMMLTINDVWRRRMINAFIIAMLITSILSYTRWLGLNIPLLLFHFALSDNSVFFERIVQYFFMSIAAFILAYRFLYHKKWRWINLGVFLLMAFNILFIGNGVTGYVIFCLLMLYLGFLRFSWKGILTGIVAGLALLSAAYLFSPSFHNRINTLPHQVHLYQKGTTHTSIGLRLGMWHNATTMIKHRPWFGYGTGSIHTAMQQTLTPQQIKITGLQNYVEYSFLNFTLQFGFVGLFIFVSVVISQIIVSFFLPFESRVIMQGFLLAFLVGSCANSFFTSFCETHLYSLFCAIYFSTLRFGERTKSSNSPPASKKAKATPIPAR